MSSMVRCPSCSQRINISQEMIGQDLLCPMCKSPLEFKSQNLGIETSRAYVPPQQPQSRDYAHPANQTEYPLQQNSGSSVLFWVFGLLGGGCLLTFVTVILLGFLFGRAVRSNIEAVEKMQLEMAQSDENLLEARAGFETNILVEQRDKEAVPTPPRALFETVKFDSPIGKMSAYLSKPDDPNEKHPAIIWKFGGFGNGIGATAWEPQPADNDQSASAFRKHGVVMMYPALRGGNDNPGFHECFFGEVDDILAAADYLAQQDFVDPKRIYLGGHSTGGTLVLLCAAASDQFRAVFAFGPVDDVHGYGPERLPFDYTNQLELKFRNPINWMNAIQSPTFVIEGAHGNASSMHTLNLVSENTNLHFHAVPGTDHFGVLGPVNELLAKKVAQDTGEECNIRLSANELRKLFD